MACRAVLGTAELGCPGTGLLGVGGRAPSCRSVCRLDRVPPSQPGHLFTIYFCLINEVGGGGSLFSRWPGRRPKRLPLLLTLTQFLWLLLFPGKHQACYNHPQSFIHPPACTGFTRRWLFSLAERRVCLHNTWTRGTSARAACATWPVHGERTHTGACRMP